MEYNIERFENVMEAINIARGFDRAEVRGAYYEGNDGPEEFGRYRTMFNIDKQEPIAFVSDNYRPVQHTEFFQEFFENLKGLNLDAFGRVQHNGNRVITDVIFKSRGLIEDNGPEFFDDKTSDRHIHLGVRLMNSYDGSLGVRASLFGFRAMCSNGLIFGKAFKDVQIRQKHIGEIDVQKIVNDFVVESVESEERLQLLVSRLMKNTIEYNTAIELMKKYIESSKHREQILRRLGVTQVKVRENGQVKYSYVEESNAKPEYTAWELYNAITGYASNGEKITPQVEEYLNTQAEKMLVIPN